MTDHPLDLRPHEVRAALDGRLSLIVRPVLEEPSSPVSPLTGDDIPQRDVVFTIGYSGNYQPAWPEFQVGDRLWGREAWRVGAWHYSNSEVALDYVDGPRKEWLEVDDPDQLHRLIDQSRENMRRAGVSLSDLGYRETLWRPSITMPRWASRLTFTVKDVEVKRVQEISEEEAVTAGAECMTPAFDVAPIRGLPTTPFRCGFRLNWNNTHGPDAWERNDWCAFYSVIVHDSEARHGSLRQEQRHA